MGETTRPTPKVRFDGRQKAGVNNSLPIGAPPEGLGAHGGPTIGPLGPPTKEPGYALDAKHIITINPMQWVHIARTTSSGCR